jgi:hypothetical protein
MKVEMKYTKGLGALALAAVLTLTSGGFEKFEAKAQEVPLITNIKKVLLSDHRVTNGHTNYPALRRALRRLALQYNFQVDSSGTFGYVTATTLTGTDIVIFHQGDGQVLTSAGETAMRNYTEVQGKPALMIHAAGAFVPCPTNGAENLSDPGCLFLAQVAVRQYFHHNTDQTVATYYMDSVKAGDIPPGALPGAAAAVIDHGLANIETKAIYTGLPRRPAAINDEWYTFRGQPRDQGSMVFNGVTHGRVNVLLSVDEATYAEVAPSLGNHPIAWTRRMGNGLVAYNSAGHSDIYIRGDSTMQKFNWRLMRYLARDFMGCMDPNFVEYKPEATVPFLVAGFDDETPCNTPVGIRHEKGNRIEGMTVSAGSIRVPLAQSGTYKVVVTNAAGKQVFARYATGGASKTVDIRGLTKGQYFVRVNTPQSGVSVAKVAI